MTPRFRKPTESFDLPRIEAEVLKRWRTNGVAAEVLARKPGRPTYVFYEGPPTANGRPGIHHVLARTLKDVVCRFWTMKGFHVPRKAGWDTHGLPVEIEVQKELGIAIKPEIESFGIGPFNERCRASVFKYKDEWERLSERMGFWLDYAHPYVTCDNGYISSVWSLLARFFEEGLLELGHKSLPWCPRCGTGLSSHELAQGYQEIQDPSVYVRFERAGPGASPGESFLAWTTTPWTLPSNVALAVHPDLDYVRVRRTGKDGTSELLIVAEVLAAKSLGKEPFEIVDRMRGAALVGARYRRPFDWLPLEGGWGEVVVAGDFVSSDEGTGIVHVAPAFGADDHAVAVKEGLAVVNGVDAQGRMDPRVAPVAGQFFRDANAELVRELERRGRLLRRETIVHAYPHCWRCKTPLLYWLRPSWYLRTTRIKDRLVALNREIEWFPPEIGTKRFGEWLENNVDWAISRERYWGTPLNLWRCEKCSSLRAVRSEAELRALVPSLPAGFDLHRPHIDGVTLPCAKSGCGGTARRTPEVVDCWFDSGAMPFAQHGWIAEKGKAPPSEHPADYIAEGLDQTRGWFYTLHVISSFLTGKPASRRVLVGNLVLDAKKQKMSKSRGNAVDPWEEIESHGIDAVRWYLLTQSAPWLPKSYDSEQVGATGREFFGTLFNCFAFFATYAEIDRFDPEAAAPAPAARPELDLWLQAEIERLTEEVGRAFESYDLTRAANLIGGFVDRRLSNWYIRRSRDRFWGAGLTPDKLAAYHTLHEGLARVALLMAPLAPFFSDALDHWLEPRRRSVHLESFPPPRRELRQPELERDMETVLDVVALGRRARNVAQINVRQPLRRLLVKGADAAADQALRGRFGQLVAEELNVHEVVVVAGKELAELRTLQAKPNFRLLGPKLGPRLNAAKQALEALSQEQVETLLREKRLELPIGGQPAVLTSDEVEVLVKGKAGFDVETDGRTLVALDTALTEELRKQGYARTASKRVNDSRRESELRVDDVIRWHVDGPELFLRAIDESRDWLLSSTVSAGITCGPQLPPGSEWKKIDWKISDDPVQLWIDVRSPKKGS